MGPELPLPVTHSGQEMPPTGFGGPPHPHCLNLSRDHLALEASMSVAPTIGVD